MSFKSRVANFGGLYLKKISNFDKNYSLDGGFTNLLTRVYALMGEGTTALCYNCLQ